MTLLRADLLDGCAIVLVDGSPALRERLESLRARVLAVAADELDGDGAAEAWASQRAPFDAIVCDAAFTTGGPALDALDRVWPVIQGVAAGALIPAGPPEAPGATRKVLLLGPRPTAGGGPSDAEPARAALENVARTLSVEWARYAIVATMIAPGAETTADDVHTLVAFLCSAAGHYYSGCRFSLGVVTTTR
jgi:NAD(P)-dependent dehydrogenase (short-subunit alcohol dehydrogenase family)